MGNPEAAYNVEYVCPGPSRLSPNLGGESFSEGPVGEVMRIAKCIDYPDCGCPEYDNAVSRWERLEEARDA